MPKTSRQNPTDSPNYAVKCGDEARKSRVIYRYITENKQLGTCDSRTIRLCRDIKVLFVANKWDMTVTN